MKILKELFDDPINFFKKKRKFQQGFLLMLISLFAFVALNQVMIQLGFVQYQLDVTPLAAILINYFTLVIGYFIITAVCFVPYKFVGGKNIKDLYTIIAYSLVPIMFLWIPNIIPQAIITVLSAILMTRGIAIYAKTSNKNGLLVTVAFIIVTILLSLLVRNFLLPFLYFV